MMPSFARAGELVRCKGQWSATRSRSVLLVGAVALGVSLLPQPVQAQGLPVVGGVALNRLEPAPAGDPFFALYSPSVAGRAEVRGYMMVDYAWRPLPYNAPNGDTTSVVEHQMFLRGDVSVAIADRLLLDANVPVAVFQSGQQPPAANFDFHPPAGLDAGDLRLAARGRLAGDNGRPFQLGIQADFFIPTAPASSYTGDGSFRAGAHLLAGGRFVLGVPLVWSVQGGGLWPTSANPKSLVYGAGLSALLLGERLHLNVEAFGSTWIGDKPPLSTETVTAPGGRNTSLELTLGAKLRVSGGLQVGAALGRSVAFSVGSPDLRAIGLIAWSPAGNDAAKGGHPGAGAGSTDGNDASGDAVSRGPRDFDGDGLNDDVDACPKVPGGLSGDPSKDGCPMSDKDHDGVEDVEDACPSLAGARQSDATRNGCPVDTDGDGIADVEDACPSARGDASDDPKQNGCEIDSDGDGVPDSADACPTLAGPAATTTMWSGCPGDADGDGIQNESDACPLDKGAASKEKAVNGCPDHVRVTGNAILLLRPIEFISYGKGRHETINPPSDKVLREVRDAIRAHPEILKIEVQGHTDDAGTEEYNKTLSKERAEAVRSWLIGAGVAPEKLVAKGYGMDKPIADNRIRTGRRKNRRVELIILEKRK